MYQNNPHQRPFQRAIWYSHEPFVGETVEQLKVILNPLHPDDVKLNAGVILNEIQNKSDGGFWNILQYVLVGLTNSNLTNPNVGITKINFSMNYPLGNTIVESIEIPNLVIPVHMERSTGVENRSPRNEINFILNANGVLFTTNVHKHQPYRDPHRSYVELILQEVYRHSATDVVIDLESISSITLPVITSILKGMDNHRDINVRVTSSMSHGSDINIGDLIYTNKTLDATGTFTDVYNLCRANQSNVIGWSLDANTHRMIDHVAIANHIISHLITCDQYDGYRPALFLDVTQFENTNGTMYNHLLALFRRALDYWPDLTGRTEQPPRLLCNLITDGNVIIARKEGLAELLDRLTTDIYKAATGDVDAQGVVDAGVTHMSVSRNAESLPGDAKRILMIDHKPWDENQPITQELLNTRGLCGDAFISGRVPEEGLVDLFHYDEVHIVTNAVCSTENIDQNWNWLIRDKLEQIGYTGVIKYQKTSKEPKVLAIYSSYMDKSKPVSYYLKPAEQDKLSGVLGKAWEDCEWHQSTSTTITSGKLESWEYLKTFSRIVIIEKGYSKKFVSRLKMKVAGTEIENRFIFI